MNVVKAIRAARLGHDGCSQHLRARVLLLQEENLRSGLLLEQGALCLLRERPPKLRKFAFHMTLAGLRFNACDQRALGARAYRFVIDYEAHVLTCKLRGCDTIHGMMASQDMLQACSRLSLRFHLTQDGSCIQTAKGLIRSS